MELIEAVIIGLFSGILVGIAVTLNVQRTNTPVAYRLHCPDCGYPMKTVHVLGTNYSIWNCSKCNPWRTTLNPVLVELNDLLTEMRIMKEKHPEVPAAKSKLQDWSDRLSAIYEKLNMEDKIRGSK